MLGNSGSAAMISLDECEGRMGLRAQQAALARDLYVTGAFKAKNAGITVCLLLFELLPSAWSMA